MLSTTCLVLMYAECVGNAIYDFIIVVERMLPDNSAT